MGKDLLGTSRVGLSWYSVSCSFLFIIKNKRLKIFPPCLADLVYLVATTGMPQFLFLFYECIDCLYNHGDIGVRQSYDRFLGLTMFHMVDCSIKNKSGQIIFDYFFSLTLQPEQINLTDSSIDVIQRGLTIPLAWLLYPDSCLPSLRSCNFEVLSFLSCNGDIQG